MERNVEGYRIIDERLLAVWLRFLHSFALADGDASEDVRTLGEVLGLPVPPDDADLEEWVTWVEKEYGVDESLSALVVRERGLSKEPATPPALTLQQRLDNFLKAQGY